MQATMTARLCALAWRDARLAEVGLLTEAERRTFETLAVPKRRHEWLLGRLAAKKAIQGALDGNAAPGAIDVFRSAGGWPEFTIQGHPRPGWHLSLSHGHGLAVALVAPQPAGVDLEKLKAVEPGAWRFYLAGAEQEWLARSPLGDAAPLIAWSLKEAAFKALKGAAPGLLPIRLVAAGNGWARLAHEASELSARYVLADGFCLAIAAAGAPPDWLAALPLSPLLQQDRP